MRLVMLDRDGVLTEERADHVKDPGELQLLPGAAAACAKLNAAKIMVAVVTNQSVVGRGIVSADMVERIHAKLRADLAASGARLDLVLTCFDAPWDAGERRKPGAGMLKEALAHFRTNPHEAVMIGDQATDLRAALAAGVTPVLVRTGKGAETQALWVQHDNAPISVYDDLHGAVEALLACRT